MIDVLQQFYRELLDWVDNGVAKGHRSFRRDDGLCANAYDFALNHTDKMVYNYPHRLEEALREQFEEQGLDRHYPFGKRSYFLRARSGSLYRCPKRLGWLRDQLEDTPRETQHEQVYA
jgi:hypothetical protein